MASNLIDVPFHRVDDYDLLEYDNNDDDSPRDVIYNIDNYFYNNKHNISKYYSAQQFVSDVKSQSDLSFIHCSKFKKNVNGPSGPEVVWTIL